MSATINSIPASLYVDVIPGVIAAGPAGLSLSELMLTTSLRAPIGAILTFPNLAAVQAYFGAASQEATEAGVYFAGYNSATIQPGSLLFAQYPIANVGAFLRGGSVASLTVAQLQAISGVLTVTIDGTPTTSSAINLSSATSFSAAAQLITTGLGLTGPTQAVATGSMGATATGTATGTSLVLTAVTGVIHPGTAASASIAGTGIPASTWITAQVSGTTGSAGTYTTNQATTASTAAITVTSTTVDIPGAPSSGAFALGQELTGTGLSTTTYITAFGTGSGGAGTYITSTGHQFASETITAVMPVVSYDSVSGAFLVISSTTGAASAITFGSGTIAASLALTQATGAVISQGAIASVPATFMAAVLATNANFATVQTIFDPDSGSGNTQKQLFAAWVNSTENQYMYICVDTDVTPTLSTNAPTCMGQILKASNSSGTALIYQPVGGGNHIGAFLGGYAASINFNATNGRATADYKSQSGIVPSVTNATIKTNLLANGYNSYDGVANRGAAWQFFDNGQISGPFLWIDTYLNQIWLSNACQNALLTLLTSINRIPYNPAGYTMVRQTLSAGATGGKVALPPTSPVAAGLNNGVITPNVPLSSSQVQVVNALAGFPIDSILSSQGWYLIIQPASPQTRQARLSPTVILLYMDGGAIQRINLSSLVVL
jgi:uncharacterized protein DUF3383